MPMEYTENAAFTSELRKLRYEKRWEPLKPKLKGLFYTTETKRIPSIVKDRWGFVATPTQYKYQFKIWGWKKNIPENVKNDICVIAVMRASEGKDTLALYDGQPISSQLLLRSLNAKASIVTSPQSSISLMFSLPAGHFEMLGDYVPFSNNLLLNWKMPYGSNLAELGHAWGHGAPASSIPTPENVEIRTPTTTDRDFSDLVIPSHKGATLRPIVLLYRKRMLLEGRLYDLLRIISQQEQMTLSTWLYQFWYHGFVTAQSWGRSPSQQSLCEILTSDDGGSTTTNFESDIPSDPLIVPRDTALAALSVPSQKCRWTIHVHLDAYEDEGDEDLAMSDHDQTFISNNKSFPLHLHKSLQKNNFSEIPEALLPVPIPEIARQMIRSPGTMASESIAFAIMARNTDLLSRTLNELRQQEVDIMAIYPFHMAAAYLDGGTTCCLVFDTLCENIQDAVVTKQRLFNAYGHTVLDAFLLTILRNHTTVTMKDIDGTLGDKATIPGQEVDICGRWSIDSTCFRTLIASGSTTIPASWKHKFCHTSIQAVTHSVSLLLFRYPTMLDIPSGLFNHQCFGCDRRLHLGPLHALVMTAFCLASAGTAEEDLFGATAYYLALVAAGAEPRSQCLISLSRLLGMNAGLTCQHQPMTPYEMAIAIGTKTIRSSSHASVRVGWSVFTTVMRIAEEARGTAKTLRRALSRQGSPQSLCRLRRLELNVCTGHHEKDTDERSMDIDFSSNCCHYSCAHLYKKGGPRFGDSPILGHVWAAVQAELANHRKISDTDSWLSQLFSMDDLLKWLTSGDSSGFAYVERSVLKPYCRCGTFADTFPGIVLREDAHKKHMANLDGFARTCAQSSLLELPESVKRCCYVWNGPHSHSEPM